MRRRRFADFKPSQQSGILSNDPKFQLFADSRTAKTGEPISASATAEFIRLECGVNSRGHLDTNTDAAKRFAALKTDFDEWAGKIPARRQ